MDGVKVFFVFATGLFLGMIVAIAAIVVGMPWYRNKMTIDAAGLAVMKAQAMAAIESISRGRGGAPRFDIPGHEGHGHDLSGLFEQIMQAQNDANSAEMPAAAGQDPCNDPEPAETLGITGLDKPRLCTRPKGHDGAHGHHTPDDLVKPSVMWSNHGTDNDHGE